ncbi:MAG TPA: lipoate--protein ligase family protein [Geobacteraceae bacterium]|nr:lipoate--protein ligase family protein [Geobacteraceae bacterium]
MISWRFIDTGPLDGPANMAVDEALLACFDPATSAPVLRLYGWHPPAFSLGRFQDAGQILDLEKCRDAGIPVVRRITGGGVIYHADELTYSIVCSPNQIPPAKSVKDSFRVLTSFLLRCYEKLGLAARYAVDLYPAGARLGGRTPLCFAGREAYDILVQGRKIGGNAQRRLKNVIFQHGSIPLRGSLATAAGYVRDLPPGLEEGTASLADFGVTIPVPDLKHLLLEAFAANFASAVASGELLTGEREMTERFLHERLPGAMVPSHQEYDCRHVEQ